MRKMLALVLIKILRKLKVTVIIGCELKGGQIETKHKHSFYYDNDIDDVLFTVDGFSLPITMGKFDIKWTSPKAK